MSGELSGIYRHAGAGGTVRRPTKIEGPAMIFRNDKDTRTPAFPINV